MAAGDEFTCASVEDIPNQFEVDCFGPKGYTIIPGVPNAEVAAVAAGTGHMCFTEVSNPGYALSCHGADGYGQASVPTAVQYGTWGPHVWAGWDRTCALDNTGDLYCWGGGASDSSLDDFIASPPNNLGVGLDVISVGHHHVCGIAQNNNELRCWGSNAAGVLDNYCIVTAEHNSQGPSTNLRNSENSADELSGAAVAGITIAAILVAVAGSLLAVRLWRRRRGDATGEASAGPDEEPISNV